MDFADLQAAVMNDRFDESQRSDVKAWINSAYWQVWVAEEWAFRYGEAAVTVTAGSNQVTNLPAALGPVRSLARSDGTKLTPVPLVTFERAYYDVADTITGLPEAYTLLAGQIKVGPASDTTDDGYLLVYEQEYTPLVGDDDTPLTPQGADLAIVFGALQIGLMLQNDFTWQFMGQQYQGQLDALRRGYLIDDRDSYDQYASDPIGYIY